MTKRCPATAQIDISRIALPRRLFYSPRAFHDPEPTIASMLLDRAPGLIHSSSAEVLEEKVRQQEADQAQHRDELHGHALDRVLDGLGDLADRLAVAGAAALDTALAKAARILEANDLCLGLGELCLELVVGDLALEVG